MVEVVVEDHLDKHRIRLEQMEAIVLLQRIRLPGPPRVARGELPQERVVQVEDQEAGLGPPLAIQLVAQTRVQSKRPSHREGVVVLAEEVQRQQTEEMGRRQDHRLEVLEERLMQPEQVVEEELPPYLVPAVTAAAETQGEALRQVRITAQAAVAAEALRVRQRVAEPVLEVMC